MMRVHERAGSFPPISELACGPEAGNPVDWGQVSSENVKGEENDIMEDSDDEENGEDAKVGASLALPAMM